MPPESTVEQWAPEAGRMVVVGQCMEGRWSVALGAAGLTEKILTLYTAQWSNS